MSRPFTRDKMRYDMQQHRTCLCACQHGCYKLRHDLMAEILDLFLYIKRLSYASVQFVHLPLIYMELQILRRNNFLE